VLVWFRETPLGKIHRVLSNLVGALAEQSWALSSHDVELQPTWTVPAGTLTVRWPRRYSWPQADIWMDGIVRALRTLVDFDVCDIAQPGRAVEFELLLDGRPHRIALDYADKSEIDAACAARCELYLKMQFRRDGYPEKNVMPAGYVLNAGALHRYLSHIRELADQNRYRFEVYGRFGRSFATEIRTQAISRLEGQRDFAYEGGFKMLRYGASVAEIARAKVCVDLPGNGDFCFRLMDYLAVGSCIVAYPHNNSFHVPLEDRVHIAYCKRDMSDLAELCAYYVEHEAERERMRKATRAFFDRFLDARQLARYYLATAARHIEGHFAPSQDVQQNAGRY